MTRSRLAAVSYRDDLHARLVTARLNEWGHACALVPADAIAASGSLNWQSDGSACRLPTADGPAVDVADLDAIWWRRICRTQALPEGWSLDAAERDTVDTDCQWALLGALRAGFDGVWLNEPGAQAAAENKLVQLAAARRVGLRIPDTLVSQDPEAIRDFYDAHDGQVVVKAVRGTQQVPLLTRKLCDDDLADAASLALVPAIYQQYVPGTSHLRVQVFGARIVAAQIDSPHLDWRIDYSVPMREVALPGELADRLQALLAALGLRMGVLDLKIAGADVYWLEINPQGQFLFLEPAAGMSLLDPFCDFFASAGARV